MSEGFLVGRDAANALGRIMEGGDTPLRDRDAQQRLAGRFIPFEIVADWEKRNGESVYSCLAEMIRFDGSEFVKDTGGFQYPLYSPLDLNDKPGYEIGSRCYAVGRGGRFEIVGGGGTAPVGELAKGRLLSSVVTGGFTLVEQTNNINDEIVANDNGFSIRDPNRLIVALPDSWTGIVLREGTGVSVWPKNIIVTQGILANTQNTKLINDANFTSPSPPFQSQLLSSTYRPSITYANDYSYYTINWTTTPEIDWKFYWLCGESGVSAGSDPAVVPGTTRITWPLLIFYAGQPSDPSQFASTNMGFFRPHERLNPVGLFYARSETEGGLDSDNPFELSESPYEVFFENSGVPYISYEYLRHMIKSQFRIDNKTWKDNDSITSVLLRSFVVNGDITPGTPFELKIRILVPIIDPATINQVIFETSFGWYVINE